MSRNCMKKLGYCFALVFILMSSFVLADISISEPNDVYNLGDTLYITADGLVGTDSGNLNVNLVCENTTTNLIKIKARDFSSEEEQSYFTDVILNNKDLEIENLTDILGECQVVLSLGTGVASTKTFDITKDVTVSASLDKSAYDPGEPITIRVDAVKRNGALLNGFIEMTNASSFVGTVENGFASDTFSMASTLEAGIYYLGIHVYDVGINGVLNEGSTFASFSINQVASSIVTSLSNVAVEPSEDLAIGVQVFDQSGIEMGGTVFVKVTSPEGETIDSIVQTGEFVDVDFVSNSSVGMWSVLATFNDMMEEREFEILGVQKVDFDFEDSVLKITNVGNMLYNKTIEVLIGNETMELELNIGLGETRRFNLKAPNGEYEILVNDGESSISQNVLLTGRVISVKDFEEVGIFKGYFIIWIFLIIVLGGVGIIFLVKYRKTKTIGKEGIVKKIKKGIVKKVPKKIKPHISNSLNFTNKSPKVQGLDSQNYGHEDKSMIDLTKDKTKGAESTLVLNGEKYLSAVVALNVKNYDSLTEVASKALRDIVDKASSNSADSKLHKNKGLVDWKGEHIFVVFSPIITKTYKNEILATKFGMEISNNLNAYNKKFKDKIEFNLGVHVGELIASKVGDKLKYTSIGNTISLAKRISDSDNSKLIVSEAIRKKLLRDLKVSKGSEVGGNQTYVVSEVKDKSADAAKLNDLLKRMK